MLEDDDRYESIWIVHSMRRNLVVAVVFFLMCLSCSFNRYKFCEPLEVICQQCYKTYPFLGVSGILAARSTPNETASSSSSTSAACPDPLMCPECNRTGGLNRITPPMLANQVPILPVRA